jgi:WhiB family redox-sensing transcriptional regulator
MAVDQVGAWSPSADAAGDEAPQRWQEQARCRGADPVLFFGPNAFEPKHERAEREDAAKAICALCPVVFECRDWAIEHGEAYGVWGGLGENDRRGSLPTVA